MTETAQPGLQRYLALDAYRGFIMLMLVSYGFGFGELKGDPTFGTIASWFEHKPWEGIAFWDLVQPGFMYIVGVAMPFALAIRTQKGAAFSDNARHVAIRSLKLIALSQLLYMGGSDPYRFQMINVLCQIALTYFLVFWIMRLRFRWQAVVRPGPAGVPHGPIPSVRGSRRAVFTGGQHRAGHRQGDHGLQLSRPVGWHQLHHQHGDDAAWRVDRDAAHA